MQETEEEGNDDDADEEEEEQPRRSRSTSRPRGRLGRSKRQTDQGWSDYQSITDETEAGDDEEFVAKQSSKRYNVLKNKIILDDTGNGQGVVPYLPLNELKKSGTN